MTNLIHQKNNGEWLQTPRAAHEAWAAMMRKSPRAAELMHLLVARLDEHNAVVISQDTIARLMGRSRRTVIRAVQDLVDDRWIEIRQIGGSGTVNAHIVNDRVAWYGSRDGIRYSKFSATVITSSEEQSDSTNLDDQPKLRKLPRLFSGERQLPSGDGLPPPSQPYLPDMEPDLPAARQQIDPEIETR